MGSTLSSVAVGILMCGAADADGFPPLSSSLSQSVESSLSTEVRELKQQLGLQQRQIDALTEELRRGRTDAANMAVGTVAEEKVSVDEGDFDGPRLLVGLSLTLAATVGGTIALENSGLLPAVKASKEYSAKLSQDPDVAASSPAPPSSDEESDEESRRLEDAVAVGLQAAREDRLLRQEQNKSSM